MFDLGGNPFTLNYRDITCIIFPMYSCYSSGKSKRLHVVSGIFSLPDSLVEAPDFTISGIRVKCMAWELEHDGSSGNTGVG